MPLKLKMKVKIKDEFLGEAKKKFGLKTGELKKKFTIKDFSFTNVLLEELIVEKKEYCQVPLNWLEKA